MNASAPRAVEYVFFDGECGLCRRGVRIVLAADRDGSRFRGRVFAVEVLAADERGATRLRLEFGGPLASPRLRVLTWRDGAYRALALPPPGGTLELPACEALDPLLP